MALEHSGGTRLLPASHSKREKGEPTFMPSASSRTTTDHDEIRQWAKERGGRPSCVRNTGGDGDIGILRIDFPGYSGEGSLEEISWDNWFEKFDERGLALLFQETTAGGQRSNFNKLVSREPAKQSESAHRGTGRGPGRSTRAKSSSGSTRSSSRSGKSTRSRNQNRSEGRSSGRKTTARAGESRGRSSSRSASSRTSSARGKRSSSRAGRAKETGTRTSRASSTRRTSSGMRTSKTRAAQGRSRSNAKGKSSRSNLRRAA